MIFNKKNHTILVADDSHTTRMLLRKFLIQEGYLVYEAKDGSEAIEVFGTCKPDIVLMDHIMPGMNGIETCAVLQSIQGESKVPIIMITGSEDEASAKAAFAAGITDYVKKPINWEVLKQRIKRLLAARDSEQSLQRSQIFSQSIIEHAALGIMTVAMDGRVKFVNPMAAAMLGYDQAELSDCKISDLIDGIDPEEFCDGTVCYLAQSRELAGRRKDGSLFPAECVISPFVISDHPFLTIMMSDVTKRKQAEEALRKNGAFLDGLLNSMPVPMFYKDTTGRYIRVNKAFEVFMGMDQQEVAGKSAFDLVPLDLARKSQDKDQQVLTNQTTQIYEAQIANAQGAVRDVVFHKAPFTDDAGILCGLIGTFLDITDRKKREEEIRYLSVHDPQTGLLNRNAIRMLQLEEDKAASFSGTRSVIFLDIDNFRVVNDALGHSAGDRMITELAAKVKACVGNRGLVYRYESDEFIVVIETTDEDYVYQIAKELLQAVSNQIQLNNRIFFLTTSIGICVGRQDEPLFKTIKNADTALYIAKKQKNHIATYDVSMEQTRTRETILEEDMQKALDKGEFVLHYQPIFDIKQSEITQAEALIRWNHPELGRVSPAEFIPIAERTKLIIPISNWVITEVCNRIAEWETLGIHDIMIGLNLSLRCFENRSNELKDYIIQSIKQAGIKPASIKLEITESVFMTNMEEILVFFRELKRFGVKMALDDFGTGYSSFGYMKDLPLDIMKLDRSLINDVVDDERAQMIVQSMITIIHGLQLHVVAEGVETLGQFEFLKGNNCDFIQGYFFSRPLPQHEFVQYYFAMKDPGKVAAHLSA